PRYLPPVPTRRSSDLYPLDLAALAERTGVARQDMLDMNPTFKRGIVPDVDQPVTIYLPKEAAGIMVSNEETIRYDYIKALRNTPDRKSTRLNSSHVKI